MNLLDLQPQNVNDNQKAFHYAHKFFDYLEQVFLEDPTVTVDVASFGAYLGISKNTDWHAKYEKYEVSARNFIQLINREKLRLLIGVPEFLSCRSLCPDCIDNYNDRIYNFADTKKRLELPARFIKQSHLKMYRIGDRYFGGGINLTNSKYLDCGFEIMNSGLQQAMQEQFDMLWGYATPDALTFLMSKPEGGEDGII